MISPIDELARKAIEAEAAMKNENSLSPKYALKLRLDARRKEFQDATTPAAWLKRSERIAELEAEAVSSKLAHNCGFNAGVLTSEARIKEIEAALKAIKEKYGE